jgi:hypothetical protein
MARRKTVTRQYSIKHILSKMEDWKAMKLFSELETAWGYSYDHTNKLINSIEGKPPYLSADKVRLAADVLGVTMD